MHKYTVVPISYARSSSFPSSPPDRCGCLPHHKCSDPACRLLVGSSPRIRPRSKTRRRRRDRSIAARSARQSAHLGTSPRRWRVSSWSPDDSRGCFGCLKRKENKRGQCSSCKMGVSDGFRWERAKKGAHLCTQWETLCSRLR